MPYWSSAQCLATGALGHTHVWLDVAVIGEYRQYSSYNLISGNKKYGKRILAQETHKEYKNCNKSSYS